MLTALGCISPVTASLINQVRLIRNAAAHLTANVNSAAAELKLSVLSLIDDDSQTMIESASPAVLRDAFVICCMILQQIAGNRMQRPEADDFRRMVVTIGGKDLERDGGITLSKLYKLNPSSSGLDRSS